MTVDYGTIVTYSPSCVFRGKKYFPIRFPWYHSFLRDQSSYTLYHTLSLHQGKVPRRYLYYRLQLTAVVRLRQRRQAPDVTLIVHLAGINLISITWGDQLSLLIGRERAAISAPRIISPWQSKAVTLCSERAVLDLSLLIALEQLKCYVRRCTCRDFLISITIILVSLIQSL